MKKETVIYSSWDPTQKNVSHVAIQTETNPKYVWRTYSAGEEKPKLPADLVTMPIEEANERFEFKQGSICELCK